MSEIIEINRERFDHANPERSVVKAKAGINEEVVRLISTQKKEPLWMLEKRLRALQIFLQKPMPNWGPDLSKLDLNAITYYIKTDEKTDATKWEDVPEDIKKTFEKLGIPEAERKALSGVGAQYNSEMAYHNLRTDLEKQGVIFENMDVALKKYSELVKEYFMTKCVPINDHKFAALHAAVWSGGCLTEDAMVFTLNPGIKSIKNINSGEEVFALDNKGKIRKAKVLAKIYTGKKKVFKIRVAGRYLEATSNHMFLCLEKSNKKLNRQGKKWKKIWKPLEEIKVGDLIAIAKKITDLGRKYNLPEGIRYIKNFHLQHRIKLPKKTSEDLMWILGIILGDGNIYFPNRNTCFINIALPKNIYVRPEAQKIIKKIFSYEVKTYNENSFTINSKLLGLWLKELGFYGKAKTKTIPNWIFGLPLNEKLALLGGLLDSDGFLEKKGKIIKFELSNKKLIEQIKLLAISCGLYSDGKILERQRHGNFYKKRLIKGGKTYSCRITGEVSRILTKDLECKKILGSNKYTFDKYNAITNENFSSMTTEDLGFAPLKEKKATGIKKVYDIQVEKYYNFIANGLIAHNSFIYIPKNVKVIMPLQAYFRINERGAGQFEHTLIIVDEGAEVHYIEGCSAPRYNVNSLHAGCVEIYVKKNARVRYSSVENWSKNTYNLNTKRAVVEENGIIEWVGGNLGSGVTMLYPCSILKGKNARAEHISIAYAGEGQHQDTGAKVIHLSPNTSSMVKSKSISKSGGITTFRGQLKVIKGAKNVKSNVQCDALMMDSASKSDTIPYMEIKENSVDIAHEATVGKISEEQLFYLMSRGLKEEEAMKLIVHGFMESIVKELPVEYAVELNRLIELEMENSVG